MSRDKTYVTQPFLPPIDEFLPYLEQIWQNKILTNNGPLHKELENALASYLGVNYISLFSNGTIALLAALKTLKIKGKVITTPYSFVATSHSLLWNNLEPVFVDIDQESMNLDPARLDAALSEDVSAILPVHCYGNPCDVNAIEAFAKKHQLKVIYDAAHAFGVKHDGGSVLNHGDLSILSFHATKVFNTFEGGAVVCHDEHTKKQLDDLKNFGFQDEVTVSSLGINGKMSEINAAFGLVQLKHIDNVISRRHLLEQRYRNLLAGIPGIELLGNKLNPQGNSSYFPIFVTEQYSLTRDELYYHLKDSGIHGRRYFFPLLSDMPMYSHLESSAPDNLPNASRRSNQVLCLPLYPNLPESTVDAICRMITDLGYE